MSTVVRMPQLAAGGTEAAIQTWLVAVGDAVSAGQPLVEIETEKAVVEHEAETAGVIAGILVAAGEAAAVGSPIAVLADAGESAEAALSSAGVAAGTAEPSPAAAPESAVPSEQSAPAAPEGAAPPVAAAPGAAAPARSAPAASSPAPPGGRRLFASPLVRRLARERGIDLTSIPGSGPNGRIVRRDLDAYVAASAVSAASAAPVAPAAGGEPAPSDARYTDVPHTGMRRAIARRLTESTTTVPHFTLSADCLVDELLELRGRIDERVGVRPSVNDFVLKAVAAALVDVPEANAIWTPDATRRFADVDVAVAVSVPDGLLTPVVRAVQRLSMSELSAKVRDLAERGREGTLRQHELEGGSFSVSNLGMYGTRRFSAIINPPHSGILAVGAATRRPVVAPDGSLTAATVMTVTLSADHRVMDGALAARWLAAFVARIENPLSLLL